MYISIHFSFFVFLNENVYPHIFILSALSEILIILSVFQVDVSQVEVDHVQLFIATVQVFVVHD
jgi:hypothetical protein